MKKLLIIVVMTVIAIGVYYFWTHKSGIVFPPGNPDTPTGIKSDAKTEAIESISKYQYTEIYTDPAGRFSFKYPKEFTLDDIHNTDNEAIILQYIEARIGAQLVITPWKGDDIKLTAEIIKAEIPGMKVENVVTGDRISFDSNNEAFAGQSHEIWFVKGGYLYQMSTYKEMGELLNGIFENLAFKNK